MNVCEERHDPKYQITYKPAKGGEYIPVWLVCESCMENKRHFGSDELIETVRILA